METISEKLADELVQMFILELNLKVSCHSWAAMVSFVKLLYVLCCILRLCVFLSVQRLVVVELLSISCDVPTVNSLDWSDELYPEEFGELSICNLYSEETCKPIYPRLDDQKFEMSAARCNQQPDHDVLQVWVLLINAIGNPEKYVLKLFLIILYFANTCGIS